MDRPQEAIPTGYPVEVALAESMRLGLGTDLLSRAQNKSSVPTGREAETAAGKHG
jgi:hypothetical protein